ncbi:MAG TPA: phosphoglucomutase/phosphomannomutase family protein [bacterium]|nr:phosphoglucomutase/phosphomannomutase family protein [bacterium]
MGKITFGTSGWRAIIAEDFTFANVKIAVAAIAQHLQKTGEAKKGLLVAGDYRFLSEEFMKVTVEVLAGHDIRSYLCPVGTPTPTVSYELLRRGTAGSINFTASHNPYAYQGLKFNGSDGGPAPVGVTLELEALAQSLAQKGGLVPETPYDEADAKGLVVPIQPKEAYFERLRELVKFDVIRKGRLKIVLDLMHGNGAGYIDQLLQESGVSLKVLHGGRDPFFGGAGHHPEPGAAELTEAIQQVKTWPAHLGLANDGDADRFGIIDSDGTYITPNEILCVLLNHLIKNRDWKGSVVRTVPTTHLLDVIAQKHGVRLHETPVGFKYIAEIMAKEPILIGGEESGGLTVHGHVPEKDGILANLLMVEVMAQEGKTFGAILKGLYQEYGPIYGDRLNLRLKPGLREVMTAKLKDAPPREIAGVKVKDIVAKDGTQFILENDDWIMVRFSGTEPLMRCYMESHSPEGLEKLRQAGVELTKV